VTSQVVPLAFAKGFPLGVGKVNVAMEDSVTLSTEVMMQEVGDEAVLLDLKSETYFGLDAVGTRIWQLAEHDGQLKSIHAAILAEYDVSAEQLEDDLKKLISELAEKGLVKVGRAGERQIRGAAAA